MLRWWDGATWTAHVSAASGAGGESREATQRSIDQLRVELEELRTKVVETTDAMILQEVGLYKYSHPLDNADAYKSELSRIEEACKACVKRGEAVTTTKKWVINGSEKDGARMVADFGKLILRAYNNEADNVVRTLRPYNLDSALARLEKQRASIAKLGESMKLAITDGYHELRMREIRLTADFLAKVSEEKEREREARERLKEEEKAQREFEAEQEKLEKERGHYERLAATLRARGDTAGADNAASKIDDLNRAIERVIERAANIRTGHVYVISNIGAFGQRVVKIGLTRRLDPHERVRELGNASVPFRFDLHALIFSEDAVGLENALHHRFELKRVNLVNARREFFYVSPQEVKEALLEMRGQLLTFTDSPEALEWRQSETTRKQWLAPSTPMVASPPPPF